IGYAPLSVPVDVIAGDTATVFGQLQRMTSLPVVKVNASAAQTLMRRELQERKRIGLGYIRDSSFIAAHGSLGGLLMDFPSIQVTFRSSIVPVITFPGPAGPRCTANVWIDGVQADAEMLTNYDPSNFAAIEVYPRAADVPWRFISMKPNRDCGAIIVWTKWAM